MEEKDLPQVTRERLDRIEATLQVTEMLIMENNMLLGDMLYARYSSRMGFEKDGSRTKDGVVIWPERMVEDAP